MAAGVELPTIPVIEPIDLRVDAVDRKVRLARAARIATVLTRRLAPVPVRWLAGRRRRPVGELIGEPLRDAVLDLGVTFVKLGQLLASSPSLSGEALADAMRGVLDRGPALAMADVRQVVESDLGQPFDEVFVEFEPTPVAAASLAVVHRARLHDGTPVAVKILRPVSEDSVRTDMAIVQPLTRWLARQFPIAGLPTLPEAIDGLAEQLAEELDLRNERRVMDWFAATAAQIGFERVRVPRTFPEACGPNLLTMEFVGGFPVDDLAAIATNDVDASRAVESLIEAWFALALCTGVFHGDMHAGNLLLTASGEVVLLDWGIVGRLPDPSRRFFRRSLEGALGDESAWIDVRDHMFATFGPDFVAQVGISPEQFLHLVRGQTIAIMTMPFSELNLLMLLPSTQLADLAGEEPFPVPSSIREWYATLRDARRRARDGDGEGPPPQSRGELLLIKQLVFFERYGKLFLGDKPLLFDPDVYRELLARTAGDVPAA